MRSQSNTLCNESDTFFIAALFFPRVGKVVHTGQRVWMLPTKHSLPGIDSALMQLFSIAVQTLTIENLSKPIQCVQRFAVIFIMLGWTMC